MKKYYDKVLFLLALVLLLLGVGFFYKQGGMPTAATNGIVQQKPTGPAFDPLEPPVVPTVTATWESPVAQNGKEEWLFGVFTPPKIWWDPSVPGWTAEPPPPPPGENPFALRFVGIEAQKFRLQLSGAVDNVMLLKDPISEEPFRVKVGDDMPSYAVKIKSRSVKRVTKDDGSVLTIDVLILQDLRTNQDVTLVAGETFYLENDKSLKFQTLKPKGSPKTWQAKDWLTSKVGDEFKSPDSNSSYTTKAINLAIPTATIEKSGPGGKAEERSFVLNSAGVGVMLKANQRPTP